MKWTTILLALLLAGCGQTASPTDVDRAVSVATDGPPRTALPLEEIDPGEEPPPGGGGGQGFQSHAQGTTTDGSNFYVRLIADTTNAGRELFWIIGGSDAEAHALALLDAAVQNNDTTAIRFAVPLSGFQPPQDDPGDPGGGSWGTGNAFDPRVMIALAVTGTAVAEFLGCEEGDAMVIGMMFGYGALKLFGMSPLGGWLSQ